jgi:hypothetical protein
MKCPITYKDIVDDCYITIEHGYGSPKDMTTYHMGPVHHSVGEAALDAIKSVARKGIDIERFARDCMEEEFGDDPPEEWTGKHPRPE